GVDDRVDAERRDVGEACVEVHAPIVARARGCSPPRTGLLTFCRRERQQPRSRRRRGQSRETTMLALWPPNPNALTSACRAAVGCAAPRTTSRSTAGSRESRLSVGGTRPSRTASSATSTPSDPDAPSRWPVAPLVLVTGGGMASAARSASASLTSPTG